MIVRANASGVQAGHQSWLIQFIRRFAFAMLLLGSLGGVAPQQAFAQAAPAPDLPYGAPGAPELPAPAPEVEQVEAKLNVPAVLEKVYLAIRNVFQNAQMPEGSGLKIVLSLFTMGIAIGGIKIAGGMDLVDAAVDFVKFSMLASFAAACVTESAWLSSLTGGAGGTIGEVIKSGFSGLVKTLVPDMAGGGPLALAGSFMEAAFRLTQVQVIPKNIAGDGIAIVLFIASNWIPMVVAVLFLVFTILAFALAGALVVGEVLFGQLSMDLAIVLAPLLAPWVLFKPMSFLFDAWLRTLLIGGMTYVVGALLAKAANSFAVEMVKASESFTDFTMFTLDSVAAVYGGMFLMSLIFLILCERVSRLAAGLISGGAVASIGITGMRSAIGATSASSGVGGANRTAAGGGGGGGGSASKAAPGAAKGGRGRMEGAGHAAGAALRRGVERAVAGPLVGPPKPKGK